MKVLNTLVEKTMEKFVNLEYAQIYQKKLGTEYAVIENPGHIYPAFELVPLAKKITTPRFLLSAAVMDMDGTTTTTETLCLHSLEYMIRQMSGKSLKSDWAGLDKSIDYPHIIGNSTTKHVEFLIKRYANFLDDSIIVHSYLYAAIWTLLVGKDKKRKEEVAVNLKNFRIGFVIAACENFRYVAGVNSENKIEALVSELLPDVLGKFNAIGFGNHVKAGIDIYYQRYHYILKKISEGKSREISKEIFNDETLKMIEPMQGIEVLLPLIKGWLGNEAGNLADILIDDFYKKHPGTIRKIDSNEVANKLNKLSEKFAGAPLKVAIVTSSIFYEADIVMSEVFNILYERVDLLPLSNHIKENLKTKYEKYQNYYDAFVTASDSNEIRLKPFRDLYSIALHNLGITRDMFETVIGFEDSESGTIAIRSAGVGLCVAVPFAETSGHDLSAAAFIAHGGIPEIIIDKNIYLES